MEDTRPERREENWATVLHVFTQIFIWSHLTCVFGLVVVLCLDVSIQTSKNSLSSFSNDHRFTLLHLQKFVFAIIMPWNATRLFKEKKKKHKTKHTHPSHIRFAGSVMKCLQAAFFLMVSKGQLYGGKIKSIKSVYLSICSGENIDFPHCRYIWFWEYQPKI